MCLFQLASLLRKRRLQSTEEWKTGRTAPKTPPTASFSIHLTAGVYSFTGRNYLYILVCRVPVRNYAKGWTSNRQGKQHHRKKKKERRPFESLRVIRHVRVRPLQRFHGVNYTMWFAVRIRRIAVLVMTDHPNCWPHEKCYYRSPFPTITNSQSSSINYASWLMNGDLQQWGKFFYF